MKCPACKDVAVSAPNRERRGAGARELTGTSDATIAKHLCSTCGTTFEVRGHGKAKRDVPVHVCGDCLAKANAAQKQPTPAKSGNPKEDSGRGKKRLAPAEIGF